LEGEGEGLFSLSSKDSEGREEGRGEEKELSSDLSLGRLVEFYKEAKKRFDEDAEFQQRAREEVVRLQGGDPDSLRAWAFLCGVSRKEFESVYRLLGVSGQLEERGESFYNQWLPEIVESLRSSGVATESEGALCVFPLPGEDVGGGGKEKKTKQKKKKQKKKKDKTSGGEVEEAGAATTGDGEGSGTDTEEEKETSNQPPPLIVQKSDGGFMYATTDLAAVRHRCLSEGARRLLYVVDSGQAEHFTRVFQTAKRAGFAPSDAELRHVQFGLVLGEDGKKFKTRSGDTVKLRDLLSEAVRKAESLLRERERTPTGAPGEGDEKGEGVGDGRTDPTQISSQTTEPSERPAEEIAKTARAVGIGAVKYADLAMNRESNYRFSYEKMLSMQGNTAPYMLYALVRVKGILRRFAVGETEKEGRASLSSSSLLLESPEELGLARKLVLFPWTLDRVGQELYPNLLSEYIFELSQRLNKFYENCPVADASSKELQESRLLLLSLVESVLSLSLQLLGIPSVERL